MSKKNLIDDLLNQKMNKIKSIKNKTSGCVSTQDIVLEFLDKINKLGRDFKSQDEYKYAIASHLHVLEGRIKTKDIMATVIPDYNEDKQILDRITIKWSRSFIRMNPNHDKETVYRIDDLLLKQMGLL